MVRSCPGEEALAAYARGDVDDASRGHLELHFDSCISCAQVVADFVRIFASHPPHSGEASTASCAQDTDADPLECTLGATRPRGFAGGGDEASTLPVGLQVGRYRVLECIGFGAMGVVYAAYDRELDRRVALKVLRSSTETDESDRNARLLREAQAMARLSHPNVITVHDVGYVDGRVFLAMEFVDGSTLKSWIAQDEHSSAEVLAVFTAAGWGLWAAHEAGLVHRDFKPENVLIADLECVRVTDFGLARLRDDAPDPAASWAGAHMLTEENLLGPSGPSRTRTGALVGTPAYMAPELYEGEFADARSDQFSFCVALYEALYRQRPFTGSSLAELAERVCTSAPQPPPANSRVPARIRRAVLKGLARDPAARHVDMRVLLEILAHGGAQRTRRVAGVAVGSGVLALAFALMTRASSVSPEPEFCRPDRGLDPVWNDRARHNVREAFRGVSAHYANEVAGAVSDRLDAFAVTWTRERDRVCERSTDAAAMPGTAALSGYCLAEDRAHFAALIGVLAAADAAFVRRAAGAAEALPDSSRCAAGHVEVRSGPMPDPAELGRVLELQEALANAEALHVAGRYADAIPLAHEVEIQARALGFVPLRAAALVLRGRSLVRLERIDEARTALEEAVWAAVEGNASEAAARAWLELAHVDAVGREDVESAHRALRSAKAEMGSAPHRPELEVKYLVTSSTLASVEGHYEDALAKLRAVLAHAAVVGKPIMAAQVLFNVAVNEAGLSRYDEAITHFEEVIAISSAELGAEHPEVGAALYNLGATRLASGDARGALEPLERANAIEQGNGEAADPRHADTLGALAAVHLGLGRLEEAEAGFRRAVVVLEGKGDPGETARRLADHYRISLAELLLAAERVDEAAAIIAQIPAPAAGSARMRWLDVGVFLALAEHRLDDADELAAACVDEAEEHWAEDADLQLMAQLAHVRVAIARGRWNDALEHVSRVLSAAELVPPDRADAELLRAHALWAVGRKAEARDSASDALAIWSALGDVHSAAQARQWIESKPDPR